MTAPKGIYTFTVQMNKERLPYSAYLMRTIKWLISNAIIGLAPLVIMIAVNMIGNGKVGNEEIKHLIKDGVILFVCCAMMGSVVIDFRLAGFDLTGWRFVAVFISPFAILGIILLEYLMICLKVIDYELFSLNSTTSKIVISLSLIYCILAKTNLYMKEDSRHAK